MGMPGSKRTLVPAGTARRARGRGAVELQRVVRLGEVEVRADLHRPVAVVEHGQLVSSRPSNSTTVAVAERTSPGTMRAGAPSPVCRRRRLDRGVQGDELGAVGERGLDLELVDQWSRRPSITSEVSSTSRPAAMTCGDRHAVAGRLEHPVGEHRHRLGVVEQQPPRPAAPGHLGRATMSRSCSWGVTIRPP
jgi:hypothetical protein